MIRLDWLPAEKDFRGALRAATDWPALRRLANCQLDFTQCGHLATAIDAARDTNAAGFPTPLRVAVAGSSTLDHLVPSIRVAGARHGLLLDVRVAPYGQSLQEIVDPRSGFAAFEPEIVLLSFDDAFCGAGFSPDWPVERVEHEILSRLAFFESCWTQAMARFRCAVIHQTPLGSWPLLVGSNEQRLAGSPAAAVEQIARRLEAAASRHGVDLLDVPSRHDGLAAWHDHGVWLRAKQAIAPGAAPMYGELVARLVSAQRGLSAKCLVLDLDNTIWGGVIGDDGLDGISLGQGSALGEAFVGIQTYAADLSKRGVILAVCSKNDEAVALEAFETHPEMVLKREHVSSFVANWDDKAANLRRVADALNIGTDALVFLDDNPFERELVRTAMPEVRVPEVGDDPADYVATLSRAGYFEAVRITAEDLARTVLYQGNRQRQAHEAGATDLGAYLAGLDMAMPWGVVDPLTLPRVVQLINKTNQFNLTTKRYTSEQVAALAADRDSDVLWFRLTDRFGDNGIIAVVVARVAAGALVIDSLLMSCRVLKRGVEAAMTNVLVDIARQRGLATIAGTYVATAKNAMVKTLLPELGFSYVEQRERFELDVSTDAARDHFIALDGTWTRSTSD